MRLSVGHSANVLNIILISHLLTVCAQHYNRARGLPTWKEYIGLCIGRSQSKVETKSNMRKFIDCDQSRMFLAEINREKKKKKKNNTIISTKNYLQNNQIFNINIKAWFVSLLHKGGSHPRQSRYMLCDLSASLEICLTEEVEGNATQNQALTSTVCQVFLLFSCVFLSFDNQELRMN